MSVVSDAEELGAARGVENDHVFAFGAYPDRDDPPTVGRKRRLRVTKCGEEPGGAGPNVVEGDPRLGKRAIAMVVRGRDDPSVRTPGGVVMAEAGIFGEGRPGQLATVRRQERELIVQREWIGRVGDERDRLPVGADCRLPQSVEVRELAPRP